MKKNRVLLILQVEYKKGCFSDFNDDLGKNDANYCTLINDIETFLQKYCPPVSITYDELIDAADEETIMEFVDKLMENDYED